MTSAPALFPTSADRESDARSVRWHATLPACMGGWCSHRDHCARHVTPHRSNVVERLCERGHEAPAPVMGATECLARPFPGPWLHDRDAAGTPMA